MPHHLRFPVASRLTALFARLGFVRFGLGVVNGLTTSWLKPLHNALNEGERLSAGRTDSTLDMASAHATLLPPPSPTTRPNSSQVPQMLSGT
jgi:hypothetical protein